MTRKTITFVIDFDKSFEAFDNDGQLIRVTPAGHGFKYESLLMGDKIPSVGHSESWDSAIYSALWFLNATHAAHDSAEPVYAIAEDEPPHK